MRADGAFELDAGSVDLLHAALGRLEEGFAALPPAAPEAGGEAMRAVLLEAAARMTDNYPYFHPLYAGQMLKPPHPVARLAYALAMWINPNNHALDGGRASSAMEKEAVAEIARMFGWEAHLGHLCGGGTMANLEALWVAGQLTPGKAVVASEQAHYTHGRISGRARAPFEAIACDARGRIDAGALSGASRRAASAPSWRRIGTTATGSVDPLPEILDAARRYGFRLHADAAYGGYFGLADNLGRRRGAPSTGSARPTRSSSIRTSTACSPTAAAACSSATRRSAGSTSTTRPTPTSARPSCTWARSAWSARGRGRPRWRSGRRCGCCRSCAAASSPRRLDASREAALALHRRLSRRRAVSCPPSRRSSTSSCGWLAAAAPASRRRARAGIFDEAAQRGLHLALAELPCAFFDLAGAGVEPDRGDGHLPALGPDEARAPRLGGPHLGDPRRGRAEKRL